MENPKKVAIYARVSTEEQKEGKTIESQVNELRHYASGQGFIVVKEYLDDGWSGSLLDRPSLDEMRDDAKDLPFDAILVNDVDRLARDMAYLLVITRDLEGKGIQIIYRKFENSNDASGKLMVNMLGSFAEYEREVILDRTRRGKRNKVENKKLIIGNIPPYGFDYIKRDADSRVEGYYQINHKESEIVKKMFELVDKDGLSSREVVKWLSDNKVPTRNSNAKWSRSTVLRILKRTDYTGLAYYNKYESVESKSPTSAAKYKRQKKGGRRLRLQSEWLPIPIPDCKIIADDQFQRVQETLNKNRVFAKRNTKHEYLMAKLLFCRCGSPFLGCPMHDKPYYRCGNRDITFPQPKTCIAKSVRSKTVDDKVWATVKSIILNPDLLQSKLVQYEKHRQKQKQSDSTGAESIMRDIKRLEAEEARIFTAYREGVIPLVKYKKEAESVQNDIKCLKDRIALILPQQQARPSTERVFRAVSDLRDRLRKGLEVSDTDISVKQKIVRGLIEKAEMVDKTITLFFKIPVPVVNTTC